MRFAHETKTREDLERRADHEQRRRRIEVREGRGAHGLRYVLAEENDIGAQVASADPAYDGREPIDDGIDEIDIPIRSERIGGGFEPRVRIVEAHLKGLPIFEAAADEATDPR